MIDPDWGDRNKVIQKIIVDLSVEELLEGYRGRIKNADYLGAEVAAAKLELYAILRRLFARESTELLSGLGPTIRALSKTAGWPTEEQLAGLWLEER
jgi:hypothetical protein